MATFFYCKNTLFLGIKYYVMNKIIQLIFLMIFISVTSFAQDTDTVKKVVDTVKKTIQQKSIKNRPGVKKEAQKNISETKEKVKEQIEQKNDELPGKALEENEKLEEKPTEEQTKKEQEKGKQQEKLEKTGEDTEEKEQKKSEQHEKLEKADKDAEEKKETIATAPTGISDENATILKVKIYDKNSMLTVDGVEIYLFEMPDGKFIDTNITINGIASFNIDKDTEYEVRACSPGYIKRSMGIFDCNSADKIFCLRGAYHFDYGPPETEENTLLAKIKMDPIAIGQTIELDNVYYDTGRSTLRPESKQELDRLYNLMDQYSTLKIAVSSHTDSRGSSKGNMTLSTNRAKACYNYLVRKGIAKDRIDFNGYGETRLLNECTDGVNCSDKQHQVNRRTEISILEIKPEPCEPKL